MAIRANFAMAQGDLRGSFAALSGKITIAGGGLAGLSLAHALRIHAVEVTVLEAGFYPRHRVCGEFISGVSDATLAALGIADVFSDARRHLTLKWFQQNRLIHRDTLPVPALGISRFVLDERLREKFESRGGLLLTHTRARPVAGDGHVWAAGRRPRAGGWIGLKSHVRGLRSSTDLEMHAGTNGYAGTAPVEDGWVNVCGLFRVDRTLAAQGADLLPAYLAAGGNSALAEQLRGGDLRPGSFSAVAGFELGRQAVQPGLLCLGDAESMIPPFTGNGMSMAFQSAEIALPHLVAWSRGTCEWASAVTAIQNALRKRFKRRLTAAAWMHRALLEPAGQSLLRSLAAANALPFKPMLALVR